MKLKAFIGGIRRNNPTREAGWTFGEVLVVVGVIAALAIGGFVVYTQLGGSTEMSQVAGQIGERAGSQNRMITSGLRSGKVSISEFSASVGTMIKGHKFVSGGNDGLNPDATGSDTVTFVSTASDACGSGGAGALAFGIRLSPIGDASLDRQERTEFQGQIIAAIKSAVVNTDGLRATFDWGTTNDPVLEDLDKSVAPAADVTPTPTAGQPLTATNTNVVYICLDDDA